MESKEKTGTSMFYTSANQETSTVLLKTAVAQVMSHDTQIEAHVLFDEGAQRSFITEELATSLNAPIEGSETLTISAFGDNKKGSRNLNRTTVKLRALNGEIIPIKVLIVPTIASPLENQSRKITQKLHYLRGLTLAHPVTDAESFEISLLIGADFYWNIVQDKIIRGNGPTAVSSKIGFLLSGPVPIYRQNNSTLMMNVLISHKQEECDLEKYWKLESMGIDSKEADTSLLDVMETFMESSISKTDGKYTTKLPWKENCPELPSNKEIVKRRTQNVVHRLAKDKQMFKMYGDIISDQEKREFIEKVNDSDDTSTCNRVHYISHHPVKKDSLTTPIRIVYNCSGKANKEGVSLNDCLADYPPLINDLTLILTRFRMRKYAVTADIEKAFLQIQLEENDRDVTRFYWLKDPTNPNSELITYRFRVVLFGATCSPFLLNATLLKHFRDNPSSTSSELESNLYVDNVLTSFQSEDELQMFYSESRDVLSNAGFNLRSWNSNSTKLQSCAQSDKILDSNTEVKILGMFWNTDLDQIAYQQLNFKDNKSNTKRECLRKSSSICDPLGLITPVTVKAKLFIQKLWKEKLTWDENLPTDLDNEWSAIENDITEATQITFQRQLLDGDQDTNGCTMHIFTDASQLAYGACVYLVTEKSTKLVMAKNRVAPVKKITLPRLELMGALVGARLATHLRKIIPAKHVYMWSDSQIVLSWIMSSKTLQPFVANRLKEIKTLLENVTWNYCPTECNPSDYLTRGISSEQLKENKLWLHGPTWILNKDKWPTWTRSNDECKALTAMIDSEIVEETTQLNIVTSTRDEINPLLDIDLKRYSSLQKAIRVTAYVLRFYDLSEF